MTIDEQILETMQQIGGIFIGKNIATIPVNLDYLEEKVAPGMEKLVLMELIMFLEELFTDYLKEERKVHKRSGYVELFKIRLDENSDSGMLVGKAKAG